MKPVTDVSEQPLSSINLAIWLEYWLWRGPGNPPERLCGSYAADVGVQNHPELITASPPAAVKWGKQEQAVEGKTEKMTTTRTET